MVQPEFLLIRAGNYTSESSPAFSPMRRVEYYELELPLVDYESHINGEVFHYPGQRAVLVTRPGDLRFSRLPFSTSYMLFRIQNEKECRPFIEQYLESLPHRVDMADCEPFIQCVRQLAALRKRYRFQGLRVQVAILQAVSFVYHMAQKPADSTEETNPVCEAVLSAIRLASPGNLTAEKLAGQLGYSRGYLDALMRNHSCKSVDALIRRSRLQKACRLLEETDLPLCDIALECGYSSQAYMTDVLKREIGETPGAFRKDQKRDEIG